VSDYYYYYYYNTLIWYAFYDLRLGPILTAPEPAWVYEIPRQRTYT